MVFNSFTEAVNAAKAGNRDAYAWLYEQTSREKYNEILGYMGGDQQRASQVMQDVYSEAWQNLSALENPEMFSNWVGQIISKKTGVSLGNAAKKVFFSTVLGKVVLIFASLVVLTGVGFGGFKIYQIVTDNDSPEKIQTVVSTMSEKMNAYMEGKISEGNPKEYAALDAILDGANEVISGIETYGSDSRKLCDLATKRVDLIKELFKEYAENKVSDPDENDMDALLQWYADFQKVVAEIGQKYKDRYEKEELEFNSFLQYLQKEYGVTTSIEELISESLEDSLNLFKLKTGVGAG